MCDTDTPLEERLAALALDLSFIRQECESEQISDADVWRVIDDPDDGPVLCAVNRWQGNPEGRKADLVWRVEQLIAQRLESLHRAHTGIPHELFALELQKLLDEIKCSA